MAIDRGRKPERNAVRHKSHLDWPISEPGHLQWEAADTLSTVCQIYGTTQAPIYKPESFTVSKGNNCY
jgi:hypothetical protein